MITRELEGVLRGAAATFKAVALVGPRQSGKTTLARAVFPDKPYVTLEDPDVRRIAAEDPRSLLTRYMDGCIFDEVQRAPELLSYLQRVLDESREPGRFILTGSQQLGLIQGVTQSLAGRVAMLSLLPFSYGELASGGLAPDSLEEALFKGGYPPIHDQHIAPEAWLNAYIATYVQRDVRQLLNVRDLAQFSRFLALCAGSVGQLFNASRLGADCGLNHGTARTWLSVLEASNIVFLLAPHHLNFRKRIVKSPKMYFHDTGLAVRLLGIEHASQLHTHPLRGALFENWVVAELLRGRMHRGKQSNLFFWRDNLGLEIDVVAETAGRLMPVEIKSGATLADDWFKALRTWSTVAADVVKEPCLVYGGTESWDRKGVHVLPWKLIPSLANRA